MYLRVGVCVLALVLASVYLHVSPAPLPSSPYLDYIFSCKLLRAEIFFFFFLGLFASYSSAPLAPVHPASSGTSLSFPTNGCRRVHPL